jgi:hypothetical protein
LPSLAFCDGHSVQPFVKLFFFRCGKFIRKGDELPLQPFSARLTQDISAHLLGITDRTIVNTGIMRLHTNRAAENNLFPTMLSVAVHFLNGNGV